MDSKNIYLKKNDEIIGLHAIGHREPHEFDLIELDGSVRRIKTNFMELEKWGNAYNQKLEMIGGSFRIFDYSIDKTAEAFISSGWEVFTPSLR